MDRLDSYIVNEEAEPSDKWAKIDEMQDKLRANRLELQEALLGRGQAQEMSANGRLIMEQLALEEIDTTKQDLSKLRKSMANHALLGIAR